MAAEPELVPVGQEGGPCQARLVIAVIGEPDPIARNVEAALQAEHFRFEYHRAPEELLHLSCGTTPSGLRSSHQVEIPPLPTLVMFNFWGGARSESVAARWQARCLEAMGQLDKCCPDIPILVIADELRQRRLIEDALDRGTDEVIGTSVAAIKPLVRMRVRTVLAGFARRSAPERTGALPYAIPAGDTAAALARLHRAAEALPAREARAAPLADLLGIDVPSLRADSGRLDARRIAATFGISLSQLAKATPVTRQALSEMPDSPRAQTALDAFARTWGALSRLLPEDQIRKWLNANHERLSGSTPLEALLDGRAERVARMLESVRNGGVD